MCERFVIANQDAVEREFSLLHAWWRFTPSYNVSTHRNVPVIRLYQGESEGVMMRWGLIPDWAEGDESKACITHAGIEELENSRAISGAWWRGQRCILPLSGFYGWQLTQSRNRQPYFARLVNRSVFGVAGLWDRTVLEENDDVIEGCTLLTVPANPLIAEVHNTSGRMPAILYKDDYETWLRAPITRAQALLKTHPQDRMVTHAVSPRINSIDQDDAQLIRPILFG